MLPTIREIKRAGTRTLREIAEALNARGVQTARGGQWYGDDGEQPAGTILTARGGLRSRCRPEPARQCNSGECTADLRRDEGDDASRRNSRVSVGQ